MILVDQNRVQELMQSLKLDYHSAYMRVKKITPIAAANSIETDDVLALVHALMQQRGIGFAEAMREVKKRFPVQAVNSRSGEGKSTIANIVARQSGESRLLRAFQKSPRR